MAPRLSGQTSIFGLVFFLSESLLGIERQGKLEKFAILTRKPRTRVRILIYRKWPVNNLVFHFLRNGKDKVIRSSMYAPYEQGGIKIIDYETMISASRLSSRNCRFKSCLQIHHMEQQRNQNRWK